jgi:dihydrofolate synthase / folylpolyglutamate synthase
MDHRELLGDTLEAIASEKAGIIKPGVPVAIGAQPANVTRVLTNTARSVGASALVRDHDWHVDAHGGGFRYSDAIGSLVLPPPSLLGRYQWDNAGIAIAALRASGLGLPDSAFIDGITRAEWPARLQRLRGRLRNMLPADWELWLDGGHNPGAGVVLADHLAEWTDRPTHLIVGMKQAKDSAEFLRPLIPHATTLWAVAEPDQHLALPVDAIIAASGGVARPGPTVIDALHAVATETGPARVLICGSLYLAGEVIKQDA